MSTGDRIREERKRLGYTQTEFAALAGVQISAQTNYENDKRAPDSDYLAAVGLAGADVRYIITGGRDGPPALKADEQLLIDRYRTSPPPLRDAALRVLLGDQGAARTQKIKKVTGQVTQSGSITVTKGAKR